MIILAGSVVISMSNNGIIGKANTAVDESDLKRVQNLAAIAWADIVNLEYNKVYSGIGTAGAQCLVFINENGQYKDVTKIPGNTCIVSNKQILIGGTIPVEFSEDGKSFVFNGQIFTVVE